METVVKQKRKMVYNEKSNRWEYQWVNVEKCVMAEADKIKVASEFFNGVSAQEIADCYHTTSKFQVSSFKTEWLYKITITTHDECRDILERIIGFYNTQRPHMSIGMQTPEAAHIQSGEQRRCWKNGWAVT